MKRGQGEIQTALAQLERESLRRERRTVEGFPVRESRVAIVSTGRPLIDFSSNDYLGLARHPEITTALKQSAESQGVGSGASHLVTGHGREHERLEEALAAFTGRERALLFSTGYMANLAVLTTLASRGESVLLDRLSHASLIDAACLSGARFKRYAHSDARSVERALADMPNTSVIATDGLFSMDGDVAPLDALANTARSHSAWLVVDDAHGLGVLGPTGRGALEESGLTTDDVPVLVGTLGKAFGTFGAFVMGSSELIELLIQRARSYIYTTALPQPLAAAARKALELSQRESWRRERVLMLAARFRLAAARAGIPLTGTAVAGTASAGSSAPTASATPSADTAPPKLTLSPIQPVMLGSSQAAMLAQQQLFAAGFCVVAIRPPTVPRGTARLRVTLSAGHSEAQVDQLVEALARICERCRESAA